MTFTKAVGENFEETSGKKFHGMATNCFHLLHLSDKFLLYAVPNDVWSLSFGTSTPPGDLTVNAVM